MKQAVREVLRIGIAGVLALILGRAFLVLGLAPPCRVTSESMEPTIAAGVRLIVDRTAYWLHGPRRWDVVVFRCPDMPLELCVKRVAGLPGERLRIHDGRVYINDAPVTPPLEVRYGPRAGQELGDSPEYQLGPEEYFVLGDNSSISHDSRFWEPFGIAKAEILGKAVVRSR